MSSLQQPDDDGTLVLIPSTVEITGGTALTMVPAADDAEVERMVWIDAIARISGTNEERHVRVFYNSEAAVKVAVEIIQAAGRAEGKGAQK